MELLTILKITAMVIVYTSVMPSVQAVELFWIYSRNTKVSMLTIVFLGQIRNNGSFAQYAERSFTKA